MINSLDDLRNIPTIIVLYPAGSSGEFLAHIISETTGVCSTSVTEWEDTRCKFQDFYGRSLNAGDQYIDPSKVVERVNNYCSTITSQGKFKVGLAHPVPYASIEFLKLYSKHCYVIEITCLSDKSLDFKFAAANAKITHRPIVRQRNSVITHDFVADHHLLIEWSDLFIDNTVESIKKIFSFVGSTASVDPAVSMIVDYIALNKEFISGQS